VTGAYPDEEFWDDLRRVTDGQTTEPLARLVIQASADIDRWMLARGVRWQAPLRGTLHLARTNIFMLGGGKAMMNALYAAAARVGSIGERIVRAAHEVGMTLPPHLRAY